jgi:hypothetical protein
MPTTTSPAPCPSTDQPLNEKDEDTHATYPVHARRDT